MKTEHLSGNNNNGDPIWASNVELLPSEECLPIIGSCQVSSILQNLDTTHNDHNLQNMDLIILHGNDYKLPLDAPLNLHTNSYIVLKDSITVEACSNSPGSASSSTSNFQHQNVLGKCPEKLFEKQASPAVEGPKTSHNHLPEDPKSLEPTDLSLTIVETSNSSHASQSRSPKNYDKESFEDMLYFVCNLCPFLCTKEPKITEHLESVHKNKMLSKLVQLKCPACANIFYHRASLKSHLLHDHCVASNDLNLIVQAVMFYSNKENNKEENKQASEGDLKEAPKSFQKNNKQPEQMSEKIAEVNMTNPEHSCRFHYSISPNKNQDKDVIDLVKPVEKMAATRIIVNLEPCLPETLSGFDVQKEVEHPIQPPKAAAHSPAQKIPLPQVDITANDSEKLITNLMKKSDPPPVPPPVVKYMNSQKCAYASCKVALGDPKKMDYHIESHWDEEFKCLECHEKFMLWKPLISHLWRIHKIDMELFACDKCDYKTNSMSKLNTVHKLTHSNVRAFHCEICKKAFKNQKQLRNHKRIHKPNLDKEVETCELCSKTFSDKRRLKNHMDSVHKKLKPFLCNYCGYKGSCRASLRMHIRSHTGEKPFSCDQCQYSTADHNSLRRHKLRHTGQKPYKCSYCPYACIQSSTYKVHLKTKHPGMERGLMFTCFMCQFRTVNKEMYNSHLVTVHKQKPS